MKKNWKTLKEVRDYIGQLNERFKELREKVEGSENGIAALSEDEAKEMREHFDNMTEARNAEAVFIGIQADENAKISQRAHVVGAAGNTNISDKEVRDFAQVSLGKALSQLAKDGKLTGLEAEVDDYARRDAMLKNIDIAAEGFAMPAEVGKMEYSRSAEQRGQTSTGQTSTAGDQGGVYVPTEINSFIAALWDRSFLNELGATRFTGLSGNQSFPVQSSKATAQELTEVEEMSDDEILWSQLPMAPNRRGTSIPVSRLLMIQGNIDTQSFVTDNLRMALGYKLEADAMVKLLALTPVALGTNGLALDWASVVAMETAIANANADMGSLGYLINSKTRGALKTTKKDSGSGIYLMPETGNTLNGYTAAVSNHVPSNLTKGTSSSVCSAGFFGNWKDLYVALWGGLVFDVERVPKKDLSEITVNAFWDVEVARSASFTSYKDILTA